MCQDFVMARILEVTSWWKKFCCFPLEVLHIEEENVIVCVLDSMPVSIHTEMMRDVVIATSLNSQMD